MKRGLCRVSSYPPLEGEGKKRASPFNAQRPTAAYVRRPRRESRRLDDVALEPLAGQPRHFVQRSGFFKQVRRSRYDRKLLFATQLRKRFPVQLNDLDVVSSDNEQ